MRNVIFDLGGVILNIDPSLSIQAFAKLASVSTEKASEFYASNPVFQKLETGKADDATFLSEMNKMAGKKVTYEELCEAWNALLLDFPKERIQGLLELKKHRRMFLLSNTNAIHASCFESRFEETFGFPMSNLFEKVYYSHDLGMRKPNADIFERVLRDAQLKAEETIMVEDIVANAVTAEKVGMRSISVQPNKVVMSDLVEEILSM